jgi:hypothetical protein
MVKLSTFLRSPFSFLFAGTGAEERVVTYVRREHRRGRRLVEILNDAFVRSRLSEVEIGRLLERPDLVHALGDHFVEAQAGQARQDSRPLTGGNSSS